MTKWTEPLECVVARIGEQCQVYAVLHRMSESYYIWWNNLFAIPSIVLATASGAGSFAIPGEQAATVTGVMSLVVGLIQTLISYFRFGQLAEAHRMLAISYNKAYGNVATEMALERHERTGANIFLTQLRSDIERYEETAPNIPEYVIRNFRKQYVKYENVKRPTIANGLEKIAVNTIRTLSPTEETIVLDLPIETPPLPDAPTADKAKLKKTWK